MPRTRAGSAWAALLTGGFMVAEACRRPVSGSLALIADAGHMLADAASLAWLGWRSASRTGRAD